MPNSIQWRYPITMTDSYLSAERLLGCKLRTLDAANAGLRDLILDTEQWQVRFLAAEADAWAPDRDVLITPRSVAGVDETRRELELDLDAKTLRASPLVAPGDGLSGLDNEGWLPPAWEQTWRAEIDPEQMVDAPPAPVDDTAAEIALELGSEPDLFAERWVRFNTLRRFFAETSDGVRMRIIDLLIDDTDWGLAYLELNLPSEDTEQALPCLMSRRCIDWLDRETETLHLKVSRQALYDAAQRADPRGGDGELRMLEDCG